MVQQSGASAQLMEDTPPDVILPHTTLNPNGKTTIIFIHGAFSERGEWNLVTPFLSDEYHLLIPDLPGHGESEKIAPFSIKTSSALLAKLLREKAHNGIAHVVGLSLGAHVGIDLISQYPELIDRAFVSGFQVFPSSALSSYIPHILWLSQRVEGSIPLPIKRWLMDGTDIRPDESGGPSMALCRQIAAPIAGGTDWPEPWPAATLIVAAGKSGILPTADHPHDAKKLAEIGKQLNAETVAMTHPKMRHPWHRQAPLLFAETAKAWIEATELPSGFNRL